MATEKTYKVKFGIENNYVVEDVTKSQIVKVIAVQGANFTPTVVSDLPATGDSSKLYLTPKNYTTGTATGNPITITLGEDAGQITSAQLDGNTTQQTYTGKNLFNYTAADYPVVDRGIAATLNSDGSITVTGVPTASYIRIVEQTMIDLLEDGATYTISSDSYSADVYLDVVATRISDGELSYPANTRAGSASFTVNKSTYSQYRVSINTYTTASWGTESKTITRKFQLEKSATATSFEPYVGGTASPNPDYPQAINTVAGTQTVEITGKNLYQTIENTTPNYGIRSSLQPDGTLRIYGKATGNSSNFTGTMVTSLPAGTYTFSITKVMPYRILLRASNNQNIGVINAGSTSATFTTTETLTSLWVWGYQLVSGTDYDDTVGFQLEAGSTATAFTKYNKQTLPIDLGSIQLQKIGTYQDYIYKSGNDWKIHHATSSITLTGQENWSQNGAGGTNVRFTTTVEDIHLQAYNTSAPVVTACQYFGATNWRWLYETGFAQGADNLMCSHNSNHQIILRALKFSDITELTTWLGQNNMLVYYALATEVDTTITDQSLIAQLETVRNATLEASNTITNTATGTNLAGDLELGYEEYDPTNRYDKWIWLQTGYEQL